MPWYWPFGRKQEPTENERTPGWIGTGTDAVEYTTIKSADGKSMVQYRTDEDGNLVREVTHLPEEGDDDDDLGTATGEDFMDPRRR